MACLSGVQEGHGRRLHLKIDAGVFAAIRRTRVVLAAAHRNHDTANNAASNLVAFCQRCHMVHDRSEHRRRRWMTMFRRKASGDLFKGPYG